MTTPLLWDVRNITHMSSMERMAETVTIVVLKSDTHKRVKAVTSVNAPSVEVEVPQDGRSGYN
jgi:hypothetical protein